MKGQSALPPGNPENPDMKIRRGAVKARARREEMPMKQNGKGLSPLRTPVPRGMLEKS